MSQINKFLTSKHFFKFCTLRLARSKAFSPACIISSKFQYVLQKLIKIFQIFHKFSNDFVKFKKFPKTLMVILKSFLLAAKFLYVSECVLNSNRYFSRYSKINNF